jgi:hypothetical protein
MFSAAKIPIQTVEMLNQCYASFKKPADENEINSFYLLLTFNST